MSAADVDQELEETAADRAAAEARDQGLPATVEDPSALATVATLLKHAPRGQGGGDGTP